MASIRLLVCRARQGSCVLTGRDKTLADFFVFILWVQQEPGDFESYLAYVAFFRLPPIYKCRLFSLITDELDSRIAKIRMINVVYKEAEKHSPSSLCVIRSYSSWRTDRDASSSLAKQSQCHWLNPAEPHCRLQLDLPAMQCDSIGVSSIRVFLWIVLATYLIFRIVR